jgi:Uma2 family endonuclease
MNQEINTPLEDDLRDEYDETLLKNGVRGKYAQRLAAGSNIVRLAPDGRAYADNAGFKVNLSHRKSFSPDAAFYIGKPTGLKFLEGAPAFAVEVQSEGDYGPKAERSIARKMKDYFAAGTLVVWDVDLMGDDAIKVYRASDAQTPTIYRRGEVAEAEPAVPGWNMPVDELFL